MTLLQTVTLDQTSGDGNPGTKPEDGTRRRNQKTEPGDRTRGQDQGTEAGDRSRGQKQRQAVLSAGWVRGPGLGQNSQGLLSVVLPRSSASCSITSVTSTCRAAHRPVRRTFLDVPAPEAAAGEKLIPASVGSEVRGQRSGVLCNKAGTSVTGCFSPTQQQVLHSVLSTAGLLDVFS